MKVGKTLEMHFQMLFTPAPGRSVWSGVGISRFNIGESIHCTQCIADWAGPKAL
jgi:hypothetical protein